jgi:hypothetical protein
LAVTQEECEDELERLEKEVLGKKKQETQPAKTI